MRIAIIGSTQYADKFLEHKAEMEKQGHDVRLPALDSHDTGALGIMEFNLALIKWADRVDIIWDCRSTCTWGDFCMAYALRKPVNVVYLESKLMKDVIMEYADDH